MITILIVDDNTAKITNIVKTIKNEEFETFVQIKTASFVSEAKQILANINVDILVLDICLPEKVGDELRRDAGIELLKSINGCEKYSYPRFVIALSEYQDLTTKFDIEAGLIHSSLLYDTTKTEWKVRLKESINTACSILKNNVVKRAYDYDLAVVCALKEELELVKRICDNVKNVVLVDDDDIYYEGMLVTKDRNIRVVIGQCHQMGMVSAATITTKIINSFAPKYLVMTGIAAGIKGKNNIGDVVAAECAWDYGAGKETRVGNIAQHKNTINQIAIDTEISAMVSRLSGDDNVMADIKRQFVGKKPDCELRLSLGPVATGASVVADSDIVKSIVSNQIRDVLAIEMEIYGMYYAARWSIKPSPKFVALKSICDFADEQKNDDFHEYAAYTSSKVLEKLAVDYFDYD